MMRKARGFFRPLYFKPFLSPVVRRISRGPEQFVTPANPNDAHGGVILLICITAVLAIVARA